MENQKFNLYLYIYIYIYGLFLYKLFKRLELNDMASTLFTLTLSVSSLIFPFLGGALYD